MKNEKADNTRKAPRRRVRKTGSPHDLKRIVWQSLIEGDLVLRRTSRDEITLKAISAISTAGGVYARLLEAEMQTYLDSEGRFLAREFGMKLEQIGDVVLRHVTDQSTRSQIASELRPIFLPPRNEDLSSTDE